MTSLHKKMELSAGGLRCAAVSDVGMRRTSNQDSLVISLAENRSEWQSHGHLLAVADGMGAHAAGELASQLATDTVSHSYHKRQAESPSQALVAAMYEANQVIHAKGQHSVDFHGMGTTCSVLLLLPDGALAAHVGDSRVYRWRGSCFDQLTFDHSLVWEMAAAGHATEEDIPAYVPKNVITRSLGPQMKVTVDLEGPFPVQSGDRFLLCSDGLTGPLKPELIGMVVAALPPQEAAQSLVDLANLRGGPDNITVLIADVVDRSQLGSASCPTQFARSASQRRARRPGPSRFAPVVGGLGAVAAVALAVVGAWIPAVLLAAAGLLLWGLGKLWSRPGPPPACAQSNSLPGRAPYRQHDCTPTMTKIEPLNDIVRQLEDLESDRDWNFDWQPIRDDRQRAHQAMACGDYPQAVVALCSAVRSMMQALREQGTASDSSIQLR